MTTAVRPDTFQCNLCGLKFSLGSFSLGSAFHKSGICTECGTLYEVVDKGQQRSNVRANSAELLRWQFGPAMPITSDSPALPEPPGSKEDDERTLSSLKERSDQAWHAMYKAGSSSSPGYRRLEDHWRSLMAEMRALEERSAERARARTRIECDAQGHPLEPWPEPSVPRHRGLMRELFADVLPWLSRDREYQETRLCRCRARGETRRVVVVVAPGRTLSKLTFEHHVDLEDLQCAACGQQSLTTDLPAGWEIRGTPLGCPRCKQRTLNLIGTWRS